MGIDDQQCPARGPSLGHVFDDGIRCEECGATRAAPSLLEWIRSIRAGQTPNLVVLSGEKAPEPREPGDPDFAALTETQWHKLEVERRYWESRGLDREDPCGR